MVPLEQESICTRPVIMGAFSQGMIVTPFEGRAFDAKHMRTLQSTEKAIWVFLYQI
jgi:hypothetical protein